MNKKLNSIFFIIGATVVNVVILIILLLIGLFIANRIVTAGIVPENMGQILLLLVFVASIIGAFFIYNRLMKFLSEKIDLEKYFDPLFLPKKK